MGDIDVLLIGSGAVGTVHLDRWMQVPGARVSIVCDANGDVALRAADRAGAEAHTDWREAIQARNLVAVDICTPPSDHVAIACAAFDRGLHVLCETPLARSPEEARAIVDAAAASRRLAMPAFSHRFHPPIQFAKDLVDADDLGRIVSIRARFSGLVAGIAASWHADPVSAGGGVLLDTAVHLIDLFRHLAGDVCHATGRLGTSMAGLHVEDSAAVLLESSGGTLGIVEASWATPGGSNVVEINGTAGACVVDYDADHVRYRTADMPVWSTRATEGVDRFQRAIAHFANAIRGHEALCVDAEDGLRANEVVANLYAASSRH